jgi:P-type Cu2+ transporter
MGGLGAASVGLDALAARLPDMAEPTEVSGDMVEVSISDLAAGDTVFVRSAARYRPTEATITEESRAVSRRVGDPIIAGTGLEYCAG